MFEFVPKIDFHSGGLDLQTTQSSLVIMSEDFMDVVAVNVAYQN